MLMGRCAWKKFWNAIRFTRCNRNTSLRAITLQNLSTQLQFQAAHSGCGTIIFILSTSAIIFSALPYGCKAMNIRGETMGSWHQTMASRNETMSASLEAITKPEQTMMPPMETMTARYEAMAGGIETITKPDETMGTGMETITKRIEAMTYRTEAMS